MSYPVIELLNYTENPDFYNMIDKVIEFAGRTCYLSYDKITKDSYRKFVSKVVHTYKHESIAGHSFFRFILVPKKDDDDLYYYAYNLIDRADGNIQVNIIPFAMSFALLVSGNYRSFKRMYDNDKIYGSYIISNIQRLLNISLFDNYNFKDSKNTIIKESSYLPFKFILVKNISELNIDEKQKLKHSYATFSFSNVNRTFSHQLVRHMGVHLKNTYSEMSQRYVDIGRNKKAFAVPYVIDNNNDIKYLYIDMVKNSINNYKSLKLIIDKAFKKGNVDIHRPEELARDVLPNAINTRIVMSATLESWKYFVNIRSQVAAQYHIRYGAKMINNILNDKIKFWR